MFIARMETDHFTFDAAGNRESTAKLAIRDGFRRHLREYIASYSGSGTDLSQMEKGLKMTVADLEDYYGINVVSLMPGECRRDGTKI